MSETVKAILVMDMPKSCTDCPIGHVENHGKYAEVICLRTSGAIKNRNMQGFKPSWCPLQEIPKKKPLTKCCGHGVVGINELSQNFYEKGWNACIDEILEGSDNSV